MNRIGNGSPNCISVHTYERLQNPKVTLDTRHLKSSFVLNGRTFDFVALYSHICHEYLMQHIRRTFKRVLTPSHFSSLHLSLPRCVSLSACILHTVCTTASYRSLPAITFDFNLSIMSIFISFFL